MTDLIADSPVLSESFDIVDDARQFFAPASTDLIDNLLAQYQADLGRVQALAELAQEGAMRYFLDGNGSRRAQHMPSVRDLFSLEGAVAALNAAFWSKALNLTDVYDCMPQARRDEWNKSICEMTTPEFSADSVRPTILGLLAARQQFFAERVDGIFRGLSGEHVTNAPEGFGKRMIIGYVRNEYGSFNYTKTGLIHDLRCVIARFMGRDDPSHRVTQHLLDALKDASGEWHSVDGGALRIRLYKKGTAHLEVHPEMAWRLNGVLAHLYPLAIPSSFREPPKRRPKEQALLQRPLPFAVLAALPERCRFAGGYRIRREDSACSAAVYAEVVRVIEAIGGKVDSRGQCSFDYGPDEVLREIAVTGCLPDHVAHQFYASSELLAEFCTDVADIGEQDQVLEPSAGRGDLAARLPKDRTTCVEVSTLHCDILRARGFKTTKADFLQWAAETVKTPVRFDRIVMNPPFSNGRALAHLQAAASVLADQGRIVAVLPGSMRGSHPLPGYTHEWPRTFQGEFDHTDVTVAVLVAQRAS